MLFYVPALLLAGLLFLGIIISYVLGLKVRQYRASRDPSFEPGGLGPLVGALLGLLSLLLAFTFNHSASDYATERDLLVAESIAIETALWRSDLYPDSLRVAFRKDFEEYITARIEYYDAGTNEEWIRVTRQKAEEISGRIWRRAAHDSKQSGGALKSGQMIPAINNMIDIEIKREDARQRHIPDPILWLLLVLCLIGSFVVGYANKSSTIDWVILCSYALMTVLTVYLILDLDRPKRGMIETGTAHQNMIELLKTLQSESLIE
jgi:hypothetical protein